MTPTRRTVQDIAFCEIDGEPSEVLSLPLAQIVQDGDLEVLSEKHAYQVRPDEAGPPCDEDSRFVGGQHAAAPTASDSSSRNFTLARDPTHRIVLPALPQCVPGGRSGRGASATSLSRRLE